MRRRRTSFSTQVLLLHLGVLLVVLVAGFALVALLLRSELERQFEQRALGVALSVAADPAYAKDLATGRPSPTGDVQQRAEHVREATDALFVVIADRNGDRWSHPNVALIGQRVSTDPDEALAGADVVAFEEGTLGLSARGKVPLRAASGAIVGEVSVGIAANEVRQRLTTLLGYAAGFAVLALLPGALGVVLLVRRTKRETLGLEPNELTDLVREHEAVLHGVQDGVLAVDSQGRIGMANEAAVRLLGTPLTGGRRAADVLPARLTAMVGAVGASSTRVVLTTDHVLVATGQQVARGGRDLGTVLTLRDRTDIDDLNRELETVRGLFDALRAQSHEHTNRLHAVSGLMSLGHFEQARDYLDELRTDPLSADGQQVSDPYLQGLLLAKTAHAAERGVQLALSQDSELTGTVGAPLAVVTVLGNLLDNAVRAAAEGARRPAWVEVALGADSSTLRMAVTDSGDGLIGADAERVFDDGWSSKPDHPSHGLGLGIARQSARRYCGDIEVLAASGPDHGAVFSATMAGVLDAVTTGVAP